MKNNKKLVAPLVILAIILVFGSAAAFLMIEEKDARFWISYASAVCALCASVLGGWLFTAKDPDQPSSYVFSTVSLIYLVAVAVAIYYTAIKFRIPPKWCAAIHILLLGAWLLVMFVSHGSHRYITEQGKAVKRQVVKARMDVERMVLLRESAAELPEDISAKTVELLSQIEERLRYSDPMQSSDTAEQAFAVETALDELETTFDALKGGEADIAEFRQKAAAAVRKIDAYNRAKKMFK